MHHILCALVVVVIDPHSPATYTAVARLQPRSTLADTLQSSAKHDDLVPLRHVFTMQYIFSVAAPHTWNSLPSDINNRSCHTLHTFKNTSKHTCSDSLNPKPPAPAYPLQDFKALYKCCIIIILLLLGVDCCWFCFCYHLLMNKDLYYYHECAVHHGVYSGEIPRRGTWARTCRSHGRWTPDWSERRCSNNNTHTRTSHTHSK